MKKHILEFFESNHWLCRLGRTILQEVMAVLFAFSDKIIGRYVIDDLWRPFIIALTVAILSPVMAMIKERNGGGLVNSEGDGIN